MVTIDSHPGTGNRPIEVCIGCGDQHAVMVRERVYYWHLYMRDQPCLVCGDSQFAEVTEVTLQ